MGASTLGPEIPEWVPNRCSEDELLLPLGCHLETPLLAPGCHFPTSAAPPQATDQAVSIGMWGTRELCRENCLGTSTILISKDSCSPLCLISEKGVQSQRRRDVSLSRCCGITTASSLNLVPEGRVANLQEMSSILTFFVCVCLINTSLSCSSSQSSSGHD